jgi:hypothetical protein
LPRIPKQEIGDDGRVRGHEAVPPQQVFRLLQSYRGCNPESVEAARRNTIRSTRRPKRAGVSIFGDHFRRRPPFSRGSELPQVPILALVQRCVRVPGIFLTSPLSTKCSARRDRPQGRLAISRLLRPEGPLYVVALCALSCDSTQLEEAHRLFPAKGLKSKAISSCVKIV